MNIIEEQLDRVALRLIERVMTEPEPIEISDRESDWHTVAEYIAGVLEARKEFMEVLSKRLE